MSEQISEETANILLENTFILEYETGVSFHCDLQYHIDKERSKESWKKKGYIKQSREEELREEIKQLTADEYCNNFILVEKYERLTKILDEKLGAKQ
jgi:hypothetical protein